MDVFFLLTEIITVGTTLTKDPPSQKKTTKKETKKETCMHTTLK